MLIAIDTDTDRRVMGWDADRDGVYRCPECDAQPLVVKRGTIVVPHFAHPAQAVSCEPEPETHEHAFGKVAIATRFHGHIEVKLDRRRADVFVPDDHVIAEAVQAFAGQVAWPDFRFRLAERKIGPEFVLGDQSFVVELQCSPLDHAEWWQRTADYNRIGLAPLWVWGLGRVAYRNENRDGDQEFWIAPEALEASTPWIRASILPVLIERRIQILILRYTRWKETLRRVTLAVCDWWDSPRFRLRRRYGVWVIEPVIASDSEEDWDVHDLIEYGRLESRKAPT